MRGKILQGETRLSLTDFTRDCRVIKKRQITYLDDGRMQYVTIETHGKPADKIWINPPPMRPKPFYPQNNGSYVVDILHQSGVGFQLLPVHYLFPNMALLGDTMDWLAAQNAHILTMPLGSRSPDDWTYFFTAAERHP